MLRRVIVFSTIVVALAGTTVLAQVRAQGFRGRAGDRIFDRLQQRLNLTDTQKNGVRALQENRQKEMESLRQEMQQQRQALRQVLRQPNPNPTDVGNATLALKETRERMRDINQRFLSGFKALLTVDQLQKLPRRFQ